MNVISVFCFITGFVLSFVILHGVGSKYDSVVTSAETHE